MRRLTIAAIALCLGLGTAIGCSPGNEAKCRKAIKNILRLTELDKNDSGPDVNKWVRSCRANASGDAIDCMIDAKTREDLAKCEGGARGIEDETSGDDKDKDESKPEESKGG